MTLSFTHILVIVALSMVPVCQFMPLHYFICNSNFALCTEFVFYFEGIAVTLM